MVNRVSLKDIDISLEPNQSGYDDIKGRITGAESLSINISSEDEITWEGGNYFPAEILDGKITISGSITKAWLNNDFINLLFPESGIKPRFTLKGKVNNSKSPSREFEVQGVVFNAAPIEELGLDGYAKSTLPFNAKFIKALD